jgi:hypothetical protein
MKTAQRLSTAARINADSAWIGGPPAGFDAEVAAAGSGGNTSIGTVFAGASLIFGGTFTPYLA